MPLREGEFDMRLSQNLKRLLSDHKITVSRLAKKIGINHTTLHNYCNGVVPRNIESLYKLASFFNISVDDLISGRDDIYKKIHIPNSQYEIVIREIKKEDKK